MKITLAALLHDIGKFLQRTGKSIDLHPYLQYLKYQDDKYSYWHSAYTAYFIDKYLTLKSFLSISSSHHLPDENIIKIADIISASHDRKDSDYDDVFGDNNPTNPHYIICRLYSIFNEIHLTNTNNQKRFIPLVALNNFNAVLSKNDLKINEAKTEYQKLFNDFINNLKKIHYDNEITLHHLIYPILKNYTVMIPANTYQTDFPTVGLFDHLKLTTAIANCLQLKTKDFIIIKYHLVGINDFVYDTNEQDELRVRSLYISILSDFIAFAILNEFDLTYENILYSIGGQGRILVPNTFTSLAKLENVNRKITNEVNLKHQGIIHFVLSYDIYDDKNLSEGKFRNAISENELITVTNIFKENFQKCSIDYNMLSKIITNNELIIEYNFGNEPVDGFLINFNELGKININPQKIKNRCYYHSLNCHKIGETKFYNNINNFHIGNNLSSLIIMDINKLGIIFNEGIAYDAQSISKFLTLSRYLELFFAKHLTSVCLKFKVFVIYSGGDDLTMIAPPEDAQKLVDTIINEFNQYTGFNQSFQFSYIIETLNNKQIKEVFHNAKSKLRKIKGGE